MNDQQQPTFTPGPWYVEEYTAGGAYCMIHAADGMTVATTTASGNARLIAVAPAMFELLQESVKMHDDRRFIDDRQCECAFCYLVRPILKHVQKSEAAQ